MPNRSMRDDKQTYRFEKKMKTVRRDAPGPEGEARLSYEDGSPIRNKPTPPSREQLRAAMNERSPRPKPAPTKPVPQVENPTRDLSVYTAARRLKNRGRQIDRAVDDASR